MTIVQSSYLQRQPSGTILYTSGTNTFTVPADVYSISVVCVGGGGAGGDGGSGAETAGGGGGALAWASNIPVRPGESLTAVIGAGGVNGTAQQAGGNTTFARGATTLITAGGGAFGTNTSPNATNPTGGTISFDATLSSTPGVTTGGASGGAGGSASSTTGGCGGGGGAGGYNGAGGAGGNGSTFSDGSSSTGGGGGGGEANSTTGSNQLAGGGGGVQVNGIVNNGTGGTGSITATDGAGGGGGSGGANGVANGGLYGGGGGGSAGNQTPGTGAAGAVRIIWGPNRYYPNDKTITFITSTSTSTSTISVPSTAIEGDIAILFDAALSTTSTDPTSVTPSGWTLITTTSNGTLNISGARSLITYKILSFSDIESTITGMTGSSQVFKTMLIFRPNFAAASATSVNVSGVNSSVTTSDPNSQAITVTGSAPYISFAHMASSGSVTTRTITGASMTEIANGTNQYVQYLISNRVIDVPSSLSVDIADTGVNTLQSASISFTHSVGNPA